MASVRAPIPWIDRFSRDDGRVCVIGLDQAGLETSLPVARIDQLLPFDRSLIVRAAVSLARGVQARLDAYGHCLPRGASEAHQVFQYEVSDWTVLLPALLLVRATFRPFRNLARYLYSPMGLDAVCIPRDITCADVHWMLPLEHGLGQATDTHVAALTWAWAFPGGRTMWDSAYSYAARGIVGINLPPARVELIASVVEAGPRLLLATGCTLVTLEPDERPFEFCPVAPATRVLHRLPRTLVPKGANVLDLRADASQTPLQLTPVLAKP